MNDPLDWDLIETAPKDGTFILGCHLGPWKAEYEQWRAPLTIAWRAYHPNAPGKKCWRDARGRPVACTHWMHLPVPPEPPRPPRKGKPDKLHQAIAQEIASDSPYVALA